MKSALITGASTGIGRASALRLDAEGWRVFAGVRREEDAASLRAGASERLVPLMLDVTDDEQIAGAADRIGGTVGRRGSTVSSTTPASPFPGRWRRCRSTTSAARSRST